MNPRRMKCAITMMTVLGLFAAMQARSEDSDDSEPAQVKYKLSLSDYSASEFSAQDVNLRANISNQTVWLGYYHESGDGFEQTRMGYERKDESELLKLTSSLQAATHGFLGLALTAEVGGQLHAILGYGRTNLRPYDNINFDPNDSVTYGAGWEASKDNDISIYRVRDNRVVKGEQIDHLLMHFCDQNGNKTILDIFNKSGPPDPTGASIAATGAAVSYEWSSYFLRLAYDPKVNFTQANMTRVTLGTYF